MKKLNSITRLLAVTFMFLTVFALPVKAAENGSITIVDKTHEGELLADIDVQLYKVAEFTDNSRTHIVLDDTFKDFELDLDNLISSGDAEESARLCENFIAGHSIQPLAATVTDQNGKAVFSNINDGIYLVVQNQRDASNYTVTSTPFYVQMPNVDKDGNVNYQVTTYPKNGVTYPQESYDISVVKIWKDNNNRDKTRPESIQVGLYGNGELNETVTLSDINNWSYAWNDLSKDVNWDVQEIEIPDSYRMKSERNQNQFIITNQLVIHRDTVTHGMIETVKGDKTTIKSVVTGDTTMLGFYVALFAFSGLMILVYAKHCKNQN